MNNKLENHCWVFLPSSLPCESIGWSLCLHPYMLWCTPFKLQAQLRSAFGEQKIVSWIFRLCYILYNYSFSWDPPSRHCPWRTLMAKWGFVWGWYCPMGNDLLGSHLRERYDCKGMSQTVLNSHTILSGGFITANCAIQFSSLGGQYMCPKEYRPHTQALSIGIIIYNRQQNITGHSEYLPSSSSISHLV